MNTKSFFSYSKQLLRHYKGVAIGIGRQMLPQKKQLLFSFGGRTEHWAGIGSELYSTENVFRQYIQQCDAIIQELGENSILPNFKNTAPDFFNTESNVLLGLTSLQIGVYELFKTKGVIPHAVMGISLGEVAAVYAAGGLSLKDTLKLTISGAHISKLESRDFIVLYLQTNFANAKIIAEKSPATLSVVYEAGENGVLAFCRQHQKEIITRFLYSQNIVWHTPHKELSYPYHTTQVLEHEACLKHFTKNFDSQPLQCNFYSSILGKMISAGSVLDNEFWFKIKHRPVLAHTVFQKVKSSGFQVMVHIGPQSFSKNQLLQISGSKIKLLDSLRAGESELKVFKNAVKQLSIFKQSTSLYFKNNEIELFKQNLNLNDLQVIQDSLPYLKYLQKKGSVHYLPRHNEWIVLDYDDIECVLKNPEIFSSTIYKSFDEVLLGADPPSHAFVRSLLQPLFSQQRLNLMGEYTSKKASELSDSLKHKSRFNFAEAFSLPLSQAVITKFIGFTDDEATSLKKSFEGHLYEFRFFDSLKQFCKHYLEIPDIAAKNEVAGILLSYVKAEKLSFEGAVSLLRMVWVAGMTTTSMLMSTAVLLLAKNPKFAEALRSNEQLINKFIEECLRLDAPESEVRRITTRDVSLGGYNISAGSIINLKLKAANRDPKYFDDPDDIFFDRPIKKHLSFGGGYHYCLGAGMARIEVKAAIKIVLNQFPKLKIEEEGLEYFPSPHLRGLSNLPVIIDQNNNL